jgi:hypothetical protein
MMLEARQNADFQHALTALGRSPEIDAEADVYGWLIGSWELDVRYYGVDVTARGMQGEAHFEWVLEAALCKIPGSCRGFQNERPDWTER